MSVLLKYNPVFPHCVWKSETQIQDEHFVSLNLSMLKNIKYKYPSGTAGSTGRIIFFFLFYNLNQTIEIHGLFPLAVGFQKFF